MKYIKYTGKNVRIIVHIIIHSSSCILNFLLPASIRYLLLKLPQHTDLSCTSVAISCVVCTWLRFGTR
jgi:hypothetical protein